MVSLHAEDPFGVVCFYWKMRLCCRKWSPKKTARLKIRLLYLLRGPLFPLSHDPFRLPWRRWLPLEGLGWWLVQRRLQ